MNTQEFVQNFANLFDETDATPYQLLLWLMRNTM